MGEIQPDAIERVARALCRYTWEREFKGRNLDAYVEIHWKDHAAGARVALVAQQDGVREAWQPIETAPKDGTEILVYIPRDTQMVVFFDEPLPDAGAHCWHRVDGLAYHRDLPTHWKPLDSPPQVRTLEQKTQRCPPP